jgi:hypothetical protein
VDEDHLRLLYLRATPQPFGTYKGRLRLANPAREALPKLGIVCSFPLARVREMIASGNPLSRGLAGPEWRFAELPTGHWPMFSPISSSNSHRRSPSGATPVGLRSSLSEAHETDSEVQV